MGERTKDGYGLACKFQVCHQAVIVATNVEDVFPVDIIDSWEDFLHVNQCGPGALAGDVDPALNRFAGQWVLGLEFG